ncbi:MAG: 23S rRNA (uracil(1939)-C(5))-methyltransferase RlmD [Oligoflexia bacterium]|nr:23S rRNA (uracil(1939)-C(5))-methyltransferase RlmD [Oligoflexia bacterium]
MSLCPNKERCGSCSLSDQPYPEQLELKLSQINAALGQSLPELHCDEILPSPKTEHYRNRMDFAIDFEGRFGLKEKGKWWKVIDGHKCILSDERIEEIFDQVHAWLPQSGLSFFCRKKHRGLLRYAVIRKALRGNAMLVIITSAPEDQSEETQLLDALAGLNENISGAELVWGINRTISDTSNADLYRSLSPHDYIEECINGSRYHISPGSFFQTNSHGAELLQRTVLEYCGELSGKRVLDLYCGNGFFTIPLSKTAAECTGVELVQAAIDDARRNGALNHSSANFLCAGTENSGWEALKPDLLVVDPPRAGLHPKALQQIVQARPKMLIYVSCNFKRFAEELKQLAPHYEVLDLRAIDLFPHTPHVELVAKLGRR